MHSIFALIISFVLVSIVLIGFLHCEFLSIIFLIVYVGAISILFLFIIMLLNIKNIDLTDKFFNYFPAGIIIGFILIIEIYLYLFWSYNIEISKLNIFLNFNNFIIKIDNLTNIEIIALLLYEDFIYLFLLCSFMLLIAMLGVIALTLRTSLKVKKQKINLQVYRKVNLKIKNKYI